MRNRVKTAAAFLAGMLVVAGVAGGQAVGANGGSTTTASAQSRPDASPVAVTFKTGHRGDSFETGALWRLRLKPGLYDATFRATLLLQPADPDATEAAAICGIISLKNFPSENTRIFAADSTVQVSNGVPAAMSGAATIRIGADTKPGLVCVAPNSTIQLFQPVAASFTTVEHRTYGETRPVPIPTAKIRGIWKP
jgi:hypothetical protein